MTNLLDDLRNSPDVMIHQVDLPTDRALVVRLPHDARKQASFLDDRVLGRHVEGGWAEWAQLEPLSQSVADAAPGFIFHIGHCGSTLISRLIEGAANCHVLREPVGLRTFASALVDDGDGATIWPHERIEKRLKLFLNLYCKPGPTIIKATSFCSTLIDAVEPVKSAKAIFCYVEPRRHFAAMLGGANNRIDLRTHGPVRLRRLRQLCSARVDTLSALSPGELAAMSWATDAACMTSPMSNDTRGRILPVDFDAFLRAPEKALGEILTHFGLAANATQIKNVLNGPVMQRYSKDARFEYSPQTRAELLAEYEIVHAGEIEKGVDWLREKARAHAPIASALDRFGGGI
ncbi:MAG: hypothetical protein KDA46_07595 [Parvularculaceae bacterium]|nr:hypothetical protein [Parvularculaceae bacterium]